MSQLEDIRVMHLDFDHFCFPYCYDEPEILLHSSQLICPRNADV